MQSLTWLSLHPRNTSAQALHLLQPRTVTLSKPRLQLLPIDAEGSFLLSRYNPPTQPLLLPTWALSVKAAGQAAGSSLPTATWELRFSLCRKEASPQDSKVPAKEPGAQHANKAEVSRDSSGKQSPEDPACLGGCTQSQKNSHVEKLAMPSHKKLLLSISML